MGMGRRKRGWDKGGEERDGEEEEEVEKRGMGGAQMEKEMVRTERRG